MEKAMDVFIKEEMFKGEPLDKIEFEIDKVEENLLKKARKRNAIMKQKLTAKDIREAVKILEKHELKPDSDGLITIEIENPNELSDFFAKIVREKKKSEYLRIIYKEDLFKTKLVTDEKGNTKEKIIRPKKVLI